MRIARRCVFGLAGLLLLGLVAIGGLYLKLAASPISLRGYAHALETSLALRLGPGWAVTVTDAALELKGHKPAIRTAGLEIRNPSGVPVVRAPDALVSLNPLGLVFGDLSPREIELRDLHLRGVIAKDGSLSFATPSDTPAVPAPALPGGDGAGTVPPGVPVAGQAAPSVVSAAAVSLLRPLIEPSGLIGALDRAKLVDARLSLVGADGRERVAFDGVDAVFEQMAGGERRFEIELRGQRGAWRAAGRVSGAEDHATRIEAQGVPVGDVMLLSGLSLVPATSDLKLDGSLAAAFTGDRLARLEGRLNASAGAIERRGRPPVRIDGASAEFAWEEVERRLNISEVRFRGEGTEAGLAGALTEDDGAGWRLAMAGRDVQVSGLDATQPPFRLDAVELGARFEEGRVRLDRLALRGEGVKIDLSGTYAPNRVGEVFIGELDVAETDARRLVRLWPDLLNPELRAYLAARLRAGRVEALQLRSKLDDTDFKAAFSDAPLSDRALAIAFTAADVALDVVDGLPQLRKLRVEGRFTGTTARLGASGGQVEMPDGRQLAFSEASYVHQTLDKPGTPGRIGFRIQGGFDALASFMRSPLAREAGAPDLDPATVRGKVNLKAGLSLVPGAIPPLDQLGIEITGTLSDIVADKLPARERLDGGQFTLTNEGGGFALKGEGRLSGSPASFDLRVPKAGTGELLVSATLDDAARQRRSLPVAPALSGPVGVRIAVPLAGKQPPRVEVDLGRAGIDGVLPGWQKPAGKPGRLTFAVTEGATTELRDIVVDAGSVHVKGQLALSATGGVERADFPNFRMSPGDDMRVQLERSGSGYRLVLRGNNADARPLLRWANAPAGKTQAKESHDVEVDVNLAILSGFNDEAMTGVSAKASARGGELRSLQFGGKFRSAVVEASLGKRDAGAPVLSVRSGDAGATLKFLDLYRRMTGGRLALEARAADGVQQGQITIDEFGLKGEPALRRIVAQSQQGASTGTDERGAAPVSRQDVDQVLFTRLATGFRRAGSRIDYTDAVIYGSQVGFNLSGWIDTARDRLDINGTFVPAYLLNNAFSQLPVVGMILGGGRTEGLIAVDFRVAGALSGPQVTVNPLTAVAPGILRKLFGWMMPEGQPGAAGPSSAEAESPPVRRRSR